ncbi:unnamed protein product [Lampetra fluviatilis]
MDSAEAACSSVTLAEPSNRAAVADRKKKRADEETDGQGAKWQRPGRQLVSTTASSSPIFSSMPQRRAFKRIHN